MTKVYCEDCKHCAFSYIGSLDGLYCTNESFASFKDTPFRRVIVFKRLQEVNENNDCSLFEPKLLEPKPLEPLKSNDKNGFIIKLIAKIVPGWIKLK